MLPVASSPGRPGVQHGGGIRCPESSVGGASTGRPGVQRARASWCQCGRECPGHSRSSVMGAGRARVNTGALHCPAAPARCDHGPVERGRGLSEAQATQLRFHVHKLPLNLQGAGESVIHLEFIWQF